VQDAYCRVLERYKEELSRPLDEAATFLSSVRTQLSTLCGAAASLSGNSTHAHMLRHLLRRHRRRRAHASAGALLRLREAPVCVCEYSYQP
jgi:hypothetical protein